MASELEDLRKAFHKLPGRDFTDLVISERAKGAAAMRERAARHFDEWCGGQKDQLTPWQVAKIVRALPLDGGDGE